MQITYIIQIFLLASTVYAGPFLTPPESPNSLDILKERQEGGEGADGIVALVMLAEDLIANDKNAWVRCSTSIVVSQKRLLTKTGHL